MPFVRFYEEHEWSEVGIIACDMSQLEAFIVDAHDTTALAKEQNEIAGKDGTIGE